jgi:outer membrane usher protein
VAAGAAAAAGVLLAPAAHADTPTLIAQIVLNGAPTGAIAEFERDGPSLFAPRSALAGLGLDLPGDSEVIDLAAIPGVRFSVDERTQSVLLTVDARAAAEGGGVRLGRSRRSGRELTDYGLYALAPPAQAATDGPLVAQIVLNGTATGAITEFERRGSALLAPTSALRGVGLHVPDTPVVDVARLPGVRFSVDDRTQSVALIADASAFARHHIEGRRDGSRVADSADWGGLIDYGFYALAEEGGESGASATLDVRLFGPGGVFASGFLATTSSEAEGANLVRLDTSFTMVHPESARRLTFGDFVGAGLSWTRPVRAAGLSLATDFAIRPDIVLEPLPEVSGMAAAPSAVDLYVNGVRRLSARTETGPFSIKRAPIVDGHGRVTLVVTDELGRQSVQSFQYYGSGELLRPGLSATAFESGLVRRGFGSGSDTYKTAFASFTGRWGLTENLTGEGHLLASEGVTGAGAGFVGKLAQAGIVGAALDLSSARRGEGARMHLSLRRQTGRYSVYASAQESFGRFVDLAGAAGDPIIVRGLLAGASVYDDRLGSFGVNYNRQERTDATFGIVAANWSRSFGRLATVYVNGFASTEDWASNGISVGLSAPLGRTRSIGADVSSYAGRTSAAVRVAQAASAEGGWAWRATAEGGDRNRVEGEVRRVSDYGDLGIGAAATDEGLAARVFGSGSVVWMGGAPRLSARTGDAFVMVDTGMPGVEISVENRPAGRTGRDGRLLIERLPAYTPTRIAVRPESVALGARIEGVSAEVRPPRGAGVNVKLPVREITSALATLVLPDGSPVPVGARVTLNGRPSGVVGYDGASYLTFLQSENRLEVDLPTGRCLVEVPHVRPTKDLPEIGPLVCRPA